MERLVVDHSLAAAWCLGGDPSGYAQAVLQCLGEVEALVPAIWPLEVLRALGGAVERGWLEAADLGRCLELLAGLPIRPIQPGLAAALRDPLELMVGQRLPIRDAVYLDLCLAQGLSLASLDPALVGAAGRCGVNLFQPVQTSAQT